MSVLLLMALLATTVAFSNKTLTNTLKNKTLNCKAGSFSLGETASVTCYFHEDLGKSLHHVYVSFSPFDSRNEVTDNEVLVCFNQRGEIRSCNSASGYNWDNVISSNLTIEIPDVQTRFAGHYSCHLVPLGDLQIKPCDLHVEDGNGPSLDLTAIILGAVGGIVLIALVVLVAVYFHRNRLNKKGRSEKPSPKTGIEISTLQQDEETNDSGTEMPRRRRRQKTFDPGTEMSTLQQHAETSDPAQMSVFGKRVEEKLEAQMSVFGKMVEEKLEDIEPRLQKLMQELLPRPLLSLYSPSTKKELEMLTEDDECATLTHTPSQASRTEAQYRVTGQSLVRIEHKAELVRWLRDTLHPADTTLHVHFIDYDTPRDLAGLDTALEIGPPSTSIDVKKLGKDIKSLSLFTDGVLLSWSGHKTTAARDGCAPTNTVLHSTFSKLSKDGNFHDFQKEKSLVVTLQGRDGATKTPPCTHHQLQLTFRDTNLAQVTWQTLITTSVREGDTRPVVCVLVGGDTESLKTAVTAVSNNIPVIVMKGTGGFADLLAWLYHKATLDYKRRRVLGKVKTVTVRVVEGETMKKIRTHFKDQPEIVTSLDTLVINLQLLTVYTPDKTDVSQDNRNMDAVLLEALIKHNQEAQIDVLLRTMKVQQKLVHVPKHTYSPSVVEINKLQLDYFIDSLLGRSPAAVSAFLTHLKPNFFDFHLARLLRLYEADVRFLQTDKLGEEDRHKPFARFRQARRDLKSYTGSVSRFPLKCRGVKCEECNLSDNADQKKATGHSMQEAKAHFLQTCLHPIQELFLWALLSGNMDLTESLWKHCDDKMAAALFARAVYLGIRKKQTNVDVKKELKEYARRFDDLAVATLKASNELDEEKTRELINKECPWWGGVSVLQQAMLTRSKLFIAQEPCRQQLAREWDGYHDQGQALCPCRSKRRLTQPDPATITSTQPDPATTTPCHGDKGAACKQAMQRIACYFTRPKSCYWISLVWQIAFLTLYSYVLLFDLRDTPSPAFIVLMVWVSDTACEEIRQLLTSSMKVGGKKDGLLTRVKAYWSQKWNKLDVFSVAGFVLGVILVLVPNQAAHKAGRVVLAVDVTVFFLRFLQILMVFRELGLLLVMAEKMVKDSARFMLLLLTVMLGYVVASESVLYPDMHFSWPTLYRLPSRAFGQTFAEIELQDIQQGDCDKDGLCPSSYGQYVVPVMLAIYVIATHVLLLNLLIARFNATFEAVKMEAERHQAWQYCQLVQEYKNRSLLPPPCNILRLLITPVIQLCAKRCLCCLCCQGPRDTDPGMEEGERMPLTSLREEESMTLTPSAQGKCVTISSRQALKDFTLELTDTNNVFQSAHSYNVPGGTQRVMLWRDDPTLTAKVTVTRADGAEVNVPEVINTSKQTTYDEQWRLQKFESEQAMFVLSDAHTSDKKQ